MKNVRRFLACLALAAALPASAMGQGDDDIFAHQINKQTAGNWSVRPDRPRPQTVSSDNPQFNQALRIHVARATANSWDVQASSPTGAAIKTGDVVLVVFFARAQQPAEGGSVLPASIQLAAAPYTTLMNVERRITGDWAQYCFSGVAGIDLPAQANVNVNLGQAAQTVDLGPVLVFDFGPDFDQHRLPNCNQ
ncbi:MAG TPA: hypothetical protein VG841_02510 [Caulobacterales bacterium]|nr:hypothetical protein [Caulobacterales bacterium]